MHPIKSFVDGCFLPSGDCPKCTLGSVPYNTLQIYTFANETEKAGGIIRFCLREGRIVESPTRARTRAVKYKYVAVVRGGDARTRGFYRLVVTNGVRPVSITTILTLQDMAKWTASAARPVDLSGTGTAPTHEAIKALSKAYVVFPTLVSITRLRGLTDTGASTAVRKRYHRSPEHPACASPRLGTR